MKKTLAIVLALCMVMALVACGAQGATSGTGSASGTTSQPEAPKAATYKLGMGVVVSTDSSKQNNAQVDATVAAVVTDADGKIVAARIDVAQNKMDVTGGAVDAAKAFQTKMELGENYNMAKFGSDNNGDGIVLEWDAQTLAFEAYVTGKTAAEVSAIELQEVNAHMIAVDEELLKAGCSMQITDFMAAIEKACADAEAVTFETADEFTLGVAAISTAAESTAAAAGTDGSVKMYTDFGAAVIGADGKILAALNDAIQPKIAIAVDGNIISADFVGTKRELGENYNMAKFGSDNNGDGIVKEWNEQSAAFSAYVIGKTAAEVSAIETHEVNAHMIAVDEELLKAGCSMQITGLMAVVAAAAGYAR